MDTGRLGAFGLTLVALLGARLIVSAERAAASPPSAADLAGAWAGTITHEGESTSFGLELSPEADGTVLVKATIPSMHLAGQPFGRFPLKTEGDRVTFGPFELRYDAAAGTLSGVVPEGLAPVYRIPLLLRRVSRLEAPPRSEPSGTLVEPLWAYEAGSALWAGPTHADGVVYVGGEDGQVHAVDAATGAKRWSYRTGGAIRTRPTVSGGAVYLQADDGFLYRLDAADGGLAWRVRVVEKPIERLPFDNPKSRYDRFGSDVTVSGDRLYLGTHDGTVLALEAGTGAVRWRFATEDAVLGAPAVAAGRVYAGSFDQHVYALDAGTGSLLWKRDTRGAVVSTPAVAGELVLVGNRAYDFAALRTRDGEPAWKRYVWFSWIESSATVRDGVAFVGSSDAATVFAFEAASGRRLWAADVFGWAWGQPAVTAGRVYVGTSSQVGYPAGHRAGVMALERGTGRTVWRYEAPAGPSGAFGFPGSPATGGGLVFVSGLDGRLLAFRE